MNGGPSDKAVEAAGKLVGTAHARAPLNAAHHPALGLERSVCLRDVVEALRGGSAGPCSRWAIDIIECKFGGGR